jgi:hypothetical protein
MKESKEHKQRLVKCPKCFGTQFYSGRYGQTACEECVGGKISLKELNKRRIVNESSK